MRLNLPDGTVRQLSQPLTLACDGLPSNAELHVEPICEEDGTSTALSLHCRGPHAVHVEVEDGAGKWDLTAFLEQGMSTVLGPGARFFLTGRQASTTFAVTASLARPEGAADAAGSSAAAMPKREQSPRAGASAKRARTGEMVGAGPGEPTADPPLSLMRVKGLSDWANSGFLGASLSALMAGPMRWVLISNYQVDFPWLLSACRDLPTAGRLVVVHGEHDQRAADIKESVRAAGLQDKTLLWSPPLPLPFGTHHSKLFLVRYDTGLRVVVHTANLHGSNCGYASQGVWHQDFPLKDADSPQASDFQEQLLRYLGTLGLPGSDGTTAREVVEACDFSAARVRLVASTPGYHQGANISRWGHPRLRKCLESETFVPAFRRAAAVAQFSSLGSLTDRWLGQEFTASLSAGRTSKGPLGPPSASALVWPTVEDVRDSLEGWFAGGSIPGSRQNISKPFLQHLWHRWGGELVGRQRAMPHIKSYTRHASLDGEPAMPFFLLTSHNLSKAAWGELQKQGTQLAVRSYELGVLLLPSLEEAYRRSRWRGFSCTSGPPSAPPDPLPEGVGVRFVAWQRGQPQGARLEGGVLRVPLPVPYSLPPQRYQPGDQPWMWDVLWPGLDSHGTTCDDPHGQHYGLIEPDGG